MPTYKTAESVSPRHPDKLCDRISDAILDAHLASDPDARVAVDVAGGHGTVFVTGEVTSRARSVDIAAIVRRIVGQDVETITRIVSQSQAIARGVDTGGAGDQGIMVGYATSETAEHLPLETVLARRLNHYLYKKWPHDGKTQITLADGQIVSIVASFQSTKQSELLARVKHWLRNEPAARYDEVVFHINPAGDWELGGFEADAGLTGRKLIVDSYGPHIPIGGGAFSGKDPSKVDRSAAYAARKIALDYLASRRAQEVYVYLAYAIGHSQPLESSVIIDGKEELIAGYDLSPHGIIALLDLKRPIYERTAEYGHFGHSSFPWEA